jgi:NADPH:quinone reductase-like Zn-dependent oxidoreductase
VGIPGITAHRALTVVEDGPACLHPDALSGRMVLVAGGAGAVGNAAIQLARWAGATVVATVSGGRRRSSPLPPALTTSSTTRSQTLPLRYATSHLKAST